MARTGKGILDGFSGSIGKTTGSKDKGKSVIRAKPRNTPKTQTQKLIESKENMANVMFYWRILKGQLLTKAWEQKKITEINNYYKTNKNNKFIQQGWMYTNGIQFLPNGEGDICASLTGTSNPGQAAYNIFKNTSGIPINFPENSIIFSGFYFSQNDEIILLNPTNILTLSNNYGGQAVRTVQSGSFVLSFCTAFNLSQKRYLKTTYRLWNIN